MGCFIHVRTCYRIFSPEVRATFRPEILNLVRNIFRCCTNTLHITKKASVIVFQRARKQNPEAVKMFGGQWVIKFQLTVAPTDTRNFYTHKITVYFCSTSSEQEALERHSTQILYRKWKTRAMIYLNKTSCGSKTKCKKVWSFFQSNTPLLTPAIAAQGVHLSAAFFYFFCEVNEESLLWQFQNKCRKLFHEWSDVQIKPMQQSECWPRCDRAALSEPVAHTWHNAQAGGAGPRADLPHICVIRRAAQPRAALQLLEPFLLF